MKQIKGDPARDNKYFITKSYGGYSPCIQGNDEYGLRPFLGSVLPNCVGATTGAFNWIIDEGCCKYLGNTNAENMITLAKRQGLEIVSDPLPGGAMVWACGDTSTGSDGAGHIAFVNDKDGLTAYTWESGWSYRTCLTENCTRRKGSGNWGQSSRYRYLGCIVNPKVDPYHTPRCVVIKKGMSGDNVRWLQWILLKEKCYTLNLKSQIDGHFGSGTLAALKRFQKAHGLDPDGYCGPATQKLMRELYTMEGEF